MSKKQKEKWPETLKSWCIGVTTALAILMGIYAAVGAYIVNHRADEIQYQVVAAQQTAATNHLWNMLAEKAPIDNTVTGRLAQDLRTYVAHSKYPREIALWHFKAYEDQYGDINSALSLDFLDYPSYECGQSTCYSDSGPLTWEARAKTEGALNGYTQYLIEPVVPPGVVGNLSWTWYGYGFAMFVIPIGLLWFFAAIGAGAHRRKLARKAAEREAKLLRGLPEPARRAYGYMKALDQIVDDEPFNQRARELASQARELYDHLRTASGELEDHSRLAEFERLLPETREDGETWLQVMKEQTES